MTVCRRCASTAARNFVKTFCETWSPKLQTKMTVTTRYSWCASSVGVRSVVAMSWRRRHQLITVPFFWRCKMKSCQRDTGEKRTRPQTRIKSDIRQVSVPDTRSEQTGAMRTKLGTMWSGAQPEGTNSCCVTSNGLLPIGDKSRTHKRGTTPKLPR